ncbi:MAG: hypothetical protein Q4F23_07000, partial [Coriobacteriia bacterium]|nr:hypothetical protein [Coriobacteriia bacterium]
IMDTTKGKKGKPMAVERTSDAITSDSEGRKLTFSVRGVLHDTSLKYLGLSLLLAYHYVLWFAPSSFYGTELLNTEITDAWLVSLCVTSMTMLITALIVKRKRHLSDSQGLSVGATLGVAFCTLMLQYLPGLPSEEIIICSLSAMAGCFEGLMITLWGECLTRMNAKFSMPHLGLVFGFTLLISVGTATVLPDMLVRPLTTVLVLASGALLVFFDSSEDKKYPTLLPKKTVHSATVNTLIVCAIGFLTGASTYYLAAIIPWETLPLEQSSFAIGIICMSIVLVAASLATKALKQEHGIFKMFPWLLVLTIVAFCIFIADDVLNLPAFLIGLVVASILEIALISYFGTLVQRGFLSPAFSFALSIGSVRLGIAAGNALAVFYEKSNLAYDSIVIYTSLIFICLMAAMLIPISKRESFIINLISAPASPAEVDVVCNQIIEEFGLSEREGEILKLVARGNTAANIANKLVISPPHGKHPHPSYL